MSGFFASTEPLEKNQILEIFKDVLGLTKLFVAPFGLPHDAADILGEFVAKKDYKSIHRCWEDFTARKVYSLKHVSDDRVAASLQYYLEIKNDREMMDAMKINEQAANSLLSPSRVVQLPGGEAGQGQGQDLDLEDVACVAFLAVATAWKRVEDDFTKGVLSKSASTTTAAAGARVLGVNTLHPCDIGYIVSFLSVATLEQLLTSLDDLPCRARVCAASTDAKTDAGTGTDTDADTKIVSVSLSYEQYQALLDIYFRSAGSVSPRMKELLASLDSLLAAAADSDSEDPLGDRGNRPCGSGSSSARNSESVASFYGGMDRGAAVFLRRLQALGWRQALLFPDTRYPPSSSSSSSSSCHGSPFSHPVLASVVYLEESLRVNYGNGSGSGGGEGDGETVSPPSTAIKHLEELHTSSMELLRVYDTVMKKRYGSASGDMKSDQELQQEEEEEEAAAGGEAAKDSILDVMFSVEEAIAQYERDIRTKAPVSAEEMKPVLNLGLQEVNISASAEPPFSVCENILASLLFERAICRIKTEEVEEALEDINRALLIDPKCAAGYKSRFKIYCRMAMMRAEEEGSSDDDDDDEKKAESSAKSLLIKSAYDALAAFILDGSTNILLAGAAEDATREACRQEAKEHFWDRNEEEEEDSDADWSDDDNDDDDDDDDEEEQVEKGVGVGSTAQVVSGEEGSKKLSDAGDRGDLGSLLSEADSPEEQEANTRLLETILTSSALPRSWLVNSYMTLFSPLHVAFDISLALIDNEMVCVDDGLDEEEVELPFAYLLQDVDTEERRVSDEEVEESSQGQGQGRSEKEVVQPKEGDIDAFSLVCTVMRLLMKCKSQDKSSAISSSFSSSSSVKTDVNINATTQKRADDDLVDSESSEKLVPFSFQSPEDGTNDDGDDGDNDDGEKVDIWGMESLLEMTREVFQGMEGGSSSSSPELVDSGRFTAATTSSSSSSSTPEDKSRRPPVDITTALHNMTVDDNDNNCDSKEAISDADDSKDLAAAVSNESSNFRQAFSAICSSGASALTGAVFKWRRVVVGDGEGEEERAPRFRLSVEVMDAVLAGSRSAGRGGDEEDEGGNSSSSSGALRGVSKRLRSRLLSLCGSIAYLCGDAMGGYQCLKASILLDDNLLDSRLKISSILLEMDEQDKAEAQLTEAKHRAGWEQDVCLDLHLAELHLHRMEYFPAVRILRAASRRLDFLLQGWQGLVQEQHTAQHIGPTLVSLHGVAEFRVTPETPLKALNILQKGMASFPDNVSLCVCYGEVLGQAGDPAGALKSYAAASALEPAHPLPYLNASRVYQQLNQLHLCKKHMAKAFELDRSLSLTLVDIAQFKLHEKRFLDQGDTPSSSSSQDESGVHAFFDQQSSEEILETAVEVSRHVSEVIDVFTARQIARFYAKLGASGLAPVFL